MCGICGIYDVGGAPAAANALRAMSDAIVHRGPDGEGHLVDGPLGLGHRRLKIIDLSEAASQPMPTPDGRHVISYNGEVYNFPELRSELQQLGRSFSSRSDTEVVLHALAEWGTDALPRFNGMFALALWDRETRELLLARDRYGIKPLYVHRSGHRLLFGSEAKAILAHPSVRAELDREALLEYFTFQNLFTERTLFRDIRLLPAGSFMRIGPGRNGDGRVQRFWDFEFAESDARGDPDEYLEELDRLFRQSVQRQLVSDVPLGSYLSGGMDSGSVTAVAAARLESPRTFTVGFDLSSASGMELGFDERRDAERMSYLCGTEHYEMVLKAGDLERVMPHLAWHLEEPRVGQSYPNFYAAQLASKFVTVVLSGAGGDELFGGYPWRYYRAVVNDGFEDYIDKYYAYWQRMLPNSDLERVFRPIASEVDGVSTRDIFRNVFTRRTPELTSPADYINHSLYLEAKTFLHGLLVVEDKLSMAHSIETRLPFLDNDLVDFAQRVPVDMKLGNLGEVVRLNENEPGPKTKRFFERARDGKLILRRAMERYIPPAVTEAEKQGFSGPDATWFRGESMDYVRRRLMDGDAAIYEYLDRDAVRGLVEDHLSGRENRRLLIWSLLSVEQWCETFLEGSAGSPSAEQLSGAREAEAHQRIDH